MIVEIKGIGFPNKGAELMLIAVMEAFEAKYENVAFVVEPQVDYNLRKTYPLFQKLWLNQYGIQWGFLGRLIPKSIRKKYGLILDSEIDVIVDASGFAYGDFWGRNKAHQRLGRYVKRWKQDSKKIILLPQAFGPFSEPALRTSMRSIIRHVDLVFARDTLSATHINSLSGHEAKTLLAPDITSLVVGSYSENVSAGTVAIIPNSKMISSSLSREAYISDMALLITMIKKANKLPVILIHEGKEDQIIGEQIASLCNTEVKVKHSLNPREIKAYIAECDAVISSRFHGLVSALTQGVPVLATSWTHKYQELLTYYACPDFLISLPLDTATDKVFNLIDRLCDPQSNQKLRTTLKEKAQENKEETREMWQRVFEIIDQDRH